MRARTLKPSIFKNELLGTSDAIHTLVFEALWCLADRAGRLEDRPLRIHAEAMPFRDKAVTEQSLGWLADNGFIIRYAVGGVGYIQVAKFKEHQNPHPREKESVIPQCVADEATPRHGQGNAKDMPSNALSSFPSPLSPFPIPSHQEGGAQTLTDERKAEAKRIAPSANAVVEWGAFTDWLVTNGKTPRDIGSAWRGWLRKFNQFGPACKVVDPPSAEDIERSRAEAIRKNAELAARLRA